MNPWIKAVLMALVIVVLAICGTTLIYGFVTLQAYAPIALGVVIFVALVIMIRYS